MTNVALCIPIRNEAAHLSDLLGALGRQAMAGLRVTLCLFFDACVDDSHRIVAEHAASLPLALCHRAGIAGPPNAGKARATAMSLGVDTLGDDGGLLLTTDADGMPADDWIARTCAALLAADVVAGRIVRLPYPPCPAQDRLEAYYDRLYALRRVIDPVAWEGAETHHCTGGANMGFTAAAYAALGGFRSLPHGEDARIADDAARLGLRVRRDATCIVHTSSRRSGRVAGGMAEMLRQQDASAEIHVGDPRDAVWQYGRQAQARRAFEIGRPAEIGGALGLTADHAIGVARDCPNAEAFAMRIVPAAPDSPRSISLERAEVLLAMIDAERIDVLA